MTMLSAVTTTSVTERGADRPIKLGSRRAAPLDRLTSREREVLGLVGQGCSNAAIAERLSTTSRTVETHISRIFTKLDLAATPTVHRRVLAALAHVHTGAD